VTIEEARDHIGDRAVYTSGYKPPADGVIVSVGATLVYVLYHGQLHPQGTDPADLTLATPVPDVT
jgi:hypothetical protein